MSHFTIRMNSRTFNKAYRFIDVGMHFKWHIVNSAVKKKKNIRPASISICQMKNKGVKSVKVWHCQHLMFQGSFGFCDSNSVVLFESQTITRILQRTPSFILSQNPLYINNSCKLT